MAKRSQRRLLRHGKDQIGCIRGLISVFDFRHSRFPKLLFNRRLDCRQADGAQHSRSLLLLTSSDDKCQRINDGSESKTATDDGKTSVKELMEEEMVNEQELNKHMKSVGVEWEESCTERSRGRAKKSRKRTNKSKRPCDTHACDLGAAENLETESPNLQVSEQNTIDLEVMLQEFFHLLHQDSTSCVKRDCHDVQLDRAYPVFEEKLRAALDQKSADDKNGKMHHSEEFMDAFQALSSNKESFFKLLRDPNSLLVKFIQDLGNGQLEGDQKSKPVAVEELTDSRSSELVNSKFQKFFRRKNKFPGWSRLKENEKCQAPSRIVVLKPGTEAVQNTGIGKNLNSQLEFRSWLGNNGQNERVTSQFSFAEIKRKLRHAMGKEWWLIPYKHQNLENGDKGIDVDNSGWSSSPKNQFYSDNEINMGNETSGPSEKRISNIYIEARKHLSEMLTNGGKIQELLGTQSPKTLAGVLSLSDLVSSPICSPRSTKKHNLNDVGFPGKDMAVQSCATYDSPHEVNSPNPNSNPCVPVDPFHANAMEEIMNSMKDKRAFEGDVEIVKMVDTDFQDENEVLDVNATSYSLPIAIDCESDDAVNICKEERISQCLKLVPFEEDESPPSPLAFPSTSSITTIVEDQEYAKEEPVQPSPIYALESLFTEDAFSPTCMKFQPGEKTKYPLQIHFEEQISCPVNNGICLRTSMENEESTFEYVEAVLLGSGLNWNEFILRWLSSEELLEASLFDEVELFSSHSVQEQKLLFDCTNEVLKEVCECYFGHSPWVSLVKHCIRPVPRTKNLICEVWKGVEWHLLVQPPLRTLDQIVGKDMEKPGTWMDIRSDTECIVIEMGESIFEELMADTILSFVNTRREIEFSVRQAELMDDETGIYET